MKANTMKKLLPLILLFVACNKSNITFKHHWHTKEGHDVTTYSHAVFCDSSDYQGEGLIELDNTTVYDSTKFGMHAGSIVFRSRVETGVKGIYTRNYCQLTENID